MHTSTTPHLGTDFVGPQDVSICSAASDIQETAASCPRSWETNPILNVFTVHSLKGNETAMLPNQDSQSAWAAVISVREVIKATKAASH